MKNNSGLHFLRPIVKEWKVNCLSFNMDLRKEGFVNAGLTFPAVFELESLWNDYRTQSRGILGSPSRKSVLFGKLIIPNKYWFIVEKKASKRRKKGNFKMLVVLYFFLSFFRPFMLVPHMHFPLVFLFLVSEKAFSISLMIHKHILTYKFALQFNMNNWIIM